ncbi:MAG: NAD(P)-dependent oxidoreductase [Myxococcota bacterium]
MSKVAFLGLGAMGFRMAANALDAGHTLAVWNRSDGPAPTLAARGARIAESPREASQGAEFVISMVTDDKASHSVWLDGESAAIHGLSTDAIAIESSTVTPTWIVELNAALGQRGHRLLEAPVVGSRPQAESRALVYLLGGDSIVVERSRTLLAAMGSTVHHVGDIGKAARFKLAVNAMLAGQVEMLGELLGWLKATGTEPAEAMAVFGELPITSAALKGIGGLIANETYEPMFPVDLVAKDLAYVVETVIADRARAPSLTMVRDSYIEAQRNGWGELNIHAVAKLFSVGGK